MATYIGFNTINQRRKFRLIDFELVKQDLVNHFRIRRGEKLMNPTFGTRIWGLLFEPFTSSIRDIVIADVNAVIAADPRVNVDSIIVTEYEHGLQVEVTLTYLHTNEIAALLLMFDRPTNTLSVK